MKNQAELRSEIDKGLATIETIAKEIRCSTTYKATPQEFDAVAREIKAHTDRIKDLAYELGRTEAVAS